MMADQPFILPMAVFLGLCLRPGKFLEEVMK
jgi:hypothetical protein